MSSAVADLEAGLQAMLTLKPPGVSGSRITSITQLCTENVQSESVLIQKLYTHFKKAPGSHKLGVLYVVDSVTRKWTEQAKLAGQPINSAAQDGTFAAGVHRVKELLPVLMTDIVLTSPNDQKEKIRKLIDIWEKGQTFPLQMLNNFKEKLDAQAKNESTTPPGSPPSDVKMAIGLHPSPPHAAPVPSNTSSILEALANMARQNQNAAAPTTSANSQVKDSQYNISNAQSNPAQPAAMNIQSLPLPFPVPPPVNVPAPAATFASHSQGPSNGVLPSFASNQTIANPFGVAPPIVPPATLDPAMQQQLMLIKALSDQGVPADKIAGVLTSMGIQTLPFMGAGAGGYTPLSLAPSFAMQTQTQSLNQAANAQNGWGVRSTDESRDHNGYHDGAVVRSPPDRYRRRSRSRSPQWNSRDARNSPSSRRREGQGYEYDRGSPAHNRLSEERGRGRGHDYRQRSPPRRRSPSPLPSHSSGGGSSKWVDFDTSIPKGSIKVLSRTLFVGGVTSGEADLRSIFSRYGKVQTCIVNKEKRHAFVKMISRAEAITAKEAMEKNRTPDSQLRTRWGVGFGPRDCSDYTTGVSIIPISKLTDADRKWMLTAEYGGSGGKPIESGMVVEEPDIEIGQGVSSKAISRRMQTDKSGNNGPKSTREREDEDRNRRGSNRDEYRDDQRGKVHKSRLDRIPNVSGPPSMPPIPPFGMGSFPFSLPNGMPMLPPGFVFPGGQAQSPSQPPPPGRST